MGKSGIAEYSPAKDQYIKGYVAQVNDDIKAFYVGGAMSNISKGITECWDGWMTQEEIENISELQGIASELDRRLSHILDATWSEGRLTYRGRPGIYTNDDLPAMNLIHRYV